jgi:hypothetical protein
MIGDGDLVFVTADRTQARAALSFSGGVAELRSST